MKSDTLHAVLHRIRTGTTTEDDAGRVDAMVRAAHDLGWESRTLRGMTKDKSRGDLFDYLNQDAVE